LVNGNVSGSGELSASGLTAANYSLQVTAQGYASHRRNVSLKPGEMLELGTIALERARRITVTYRVASSPSFTQSRTVRQTVLGGGWFRANLQDNPIDLQFAQNRGEIRFQAAYGPCAITDLGPGKLDDFLDPDLTGARFTDVDKVVPRPDHIYLLRQEALKHSVLFQLELDQNTAK
jgi:hypothetical protein